MFCIKYYLLCQGWGKYYRTSNQIPHGEHAPHLSLALCEQLWWGRVMNFSWCGWYSPVFIFLYLWYDLQYLIQLHTKLIIYIDIMDILPHILIIYSTAKGTIKKYLQILYSYSELSVCGLKWTRPRQTENKRTGHIYCWPKSFLYTG